MAFDIFNDFEYQQMISEYLKVIKSGRGFYHKS